MSLKKYIIGIEGGGTKSTCGLFSLNGKILVKENGLAINPNDVGFDIASNRIINLIKKCILQKNILFDDLFAISIGSSGCGNLMNQLLMKKKIKEKIGRNVPKIFVTSDAEISLYREFQNDYGIIAICGTGSIIFGKTNDNKIVRSGGFGKILGDYGSAYTISIDVLKKMMDEIDRKKIDLQLVKLVMKFFKTKSMINVPSLISKNKNDIQHLVKPILSLAKDGNQICKNILNYHLKNFLAQILLMRKTFFQTKKIKIVFKGSLLENNNYFSNHIKNKVMETNKFILYKSSKDNILGAFYLAKNKLR